MIQSSNSFKFFRKEKYEVCVKEREKEKPLIHLNLISAAIIFSFTCLQRFSIMITIFLFFKIQHQTVLFTIISVMTK